MTPTRLQDSWSLPKQRVLRRVLQRDPSLEYWVYVPGTGGNDAPLFVTVHGISRNSQEHATLFAPYAEALGAVMVAPTFTSDRFPDYQRLGRVGRGARADAALHAILEEASWLTGASSARIYLFGHSGGAQFAHRYTLAHPRRVARTVVASAGWYTLPTTRRKYPYGLRPSSRLPGVRFDPEEFLRVPIAVLVGEEDGTDRNFRHTTRLDAEQGDTRLARARSWVAAMREAAAAYRIEPRVSFEQVPGHDHSFRQFMKNGQLGDRVFEALFGLPFSSSPARLNGDLADGNGIEREQARVPKTV